MTADLRADGPTTEPEIRLSATITQPAARPEPRVFLEDGRRRRSSGCHAGRRGIFELALVEITFDKHKPSSVTAMKKRRSNRAWNDRQKARRASSESVNP